jgi:Domain of unknown function (DU1801)
MSESSDLQTLLDRSSPEVQALMLETRAVVIATLPNAIEHVHMGYGMIHFQVTSSMRTLMIALAPQRDYINVEFRHGVDLPDPAHKLEGKGKALRHVKVRTAADAHTPELAALMLEEAKVAGLK